MIRTPARTNVLSFGTVGNSTPCILDGTLSTVMIRQMSARQFRYAIRVHCNALFILVSHSRVTLLSA